MPEYFIAWWNLENLFDVQNSAQRPAWLQKELNKELQGWDQPILDKKISQLSKIIRKLNGGTGPDILGVCEVENKPVVDLLVQSLAPLGKNYKVEHHDTSDLRGIDVAFIYDSAKFTAAGQFSHIILKRTATRDLFQVNFKTANNKLLILIGNHWPSRTGGEFETEPYRILAGETMSYWLSRIPEKSGEANVGILMMGDFNDEPFNRSLTKHTLGTNCEQKVLNAKTPVVFNLMWPFLGKGLGTHYFDSTPNVLDQFLASKTILNEKSGFKLKKDTAGSCLVNIEMFPEMTAQGDYPKPIRFGRPSSGLNQNGYSDHFPILMVLEEV
jgi:hypothetical protein